jgi:hypothetical protein
VPLPAQLCLRLVCIWFAWNIESFVILRVLGRHRVFSKPLRARRFTKENNKSHDVRRSSNLASHDHFSESG